MALTRKTLARQAFEALVRYILDEHLEPGDALPSTADLTVQFGISRPVVREALSALQACGFVHVRNGLSPTVAQRDGRLIRMSVARSAHICDRPMSALIEVRSPLEVQASRLAAQRALFDAEAYPELDALFHSQIARATENHILLDDRLDPNGTDGDDRGCPRIPR